MQDQDTGPRPPEATKQPDLVFKELLDRLEATRDKHGGVTFGVSKDDYWPGDARAVILPEPLIEEDGKKRTYVVATADGPKGIVIVYDGESSITRKNEEWLQRYLREADARGGVVEHVGNNRVGYLSPKFPWGGRIILLTEREAPPVEVYPRGARAKSSYLSFADVDEDTVVKAYDANVAKQSEIKSAQRPETGQQGLPAANALMQRLGPRTP